MKWRGGVVVTPDKKKYPCCANLYNFLNNFPDPNTMQSEMNASRFLGLRSITMGVKI
jgi:hypothetical protein